MIQDYFRDSSVKNFQVLFPNCSVGVGDAGKHIGKYGKK